VLVVSPDSRNERASDVIVVPVSTVLRFGPWHVQLRKREAGLSQAYELRCKQVTTLPRDRIEPRPIGGPLSPSRMNEVVRAILRAIGVPAGVGG
jgi:mRNA-degrading endonuclease toxin of MazEF toxin-antitoxin module